MTREEFFYKYGCECKDPNCSSVVKNKCSAEFYRDLDSVIENEKEGKIFSEIGKCEPEEEKAFINFLSMFKDVLPKSIIVAYIQEFIQENGPLSNDGGDFLKSILEEKDDE